jgi:tRNA-uridine 2-sulfurtransferase
VHVVAAMSGGVDSAVAAAALLEQGHSVTGVFLRNGIEAGPRAAKAKQGCCGIGDAADASRVADRLGIPFYSLDFAAEFDTVIEDFAAAYAAGRTPNPCIDCNRDLKFGKLLRFADALGADAVATGHYAALEGRAGRHALRIPEDRRKDQTYVLFPLSQEQLARTVFPLAQWCKDEIRARARDLGLLVSEKPESMEICFVPRGDYRGILEGRAPEALLQGPLIDRDTGKTLGRHGGVGAYTIGQRRGLGLPGGEGARYVSDIDAEANVVYVSQADGLLRDEVIVQRWNGVAVPAPQPGERLQGAARVRRNHVPQPAVAVGETGDDGVPQVRVHFDPPVRSPAPGQALVLYDAGGWVLGGGWIAGSTRAD